MPINRQFPIREPLIDPASGLLTDRWRIYFRDMQQEQDQTPTLVVTPVFLDGQHAAITTTAIPTDSLAPGGYRLSYYTRVTTAAGVSSSYQLTFGWTDGGVALTKSGATLNGNTTSTYESDVFPILVDQATPVTYAATYASNPAAAMQFQLWMALEYVGAA